jgi:hypothetical protein
MFSNVLCCSSKFFISVLSLIMDHNLGCL